MCGVELVPRPVPTREKPSSTFCFKTKYSYPINEGLEGSQLTTHSPLRTDQSTTYLVHVYDVPGRPTYHRWNIEPLPFGFWVLDFACVVF